MNERERILTVADITDDFADAFYAEVIDGWYEDKIDWDEALTRWETRHLGERVSFPSDWTSPAIAKLQRKVRAIHRARRERRDAVARLVERIQAKAQ